MDDSLLQGQRFLGLWGFWKEWRWISCTTSLGLGLQQRERGAWDPLGGAGAPAHRSKGCALKMKGGRVWEEEGRQKSGATGEGGGGGGRHLGEHLALAGRRLAVREQAPVVSSPHSRWRWTGRRAVLPSFSSSRMEHLTRWPAAWGAHSSTGAGGGNVCRDKHDGVRGEVQGCRGRWQGPGARYQVVPEAVWQGGTDSRAALPREAGQRSPGGECLGAKAGLEAARPGAVEGSEFGSSWSWRHRRGQAVGGSERLHGWLQPPAGWESVAGGWGGGESAIRGMGRGHWGRWAPMIPQIVPE